MFNTRKVFPNVVVRSFGYTENGIFVVFVEVICKHKLCVVVIEAELNSCDTGIDYNVFNRNANGYGFAGLVTSGYFDVEIEDAVSVCGTCEIGKFVGVDRSIFDSCYSQQTRGKREYHSNSKSRESF